MNDLCPRHQDLLAFHQGNAALALQDQIAAHLEHCPGCERVLQELDRVTDEMLSILRRPRTESCSNSAVLDPLQPDLELTLVKSDRELAQGGSRPGRDDPAPIIPGYEILEILGRGGMGMVYKARQLALNRIVAVKTLLPSLRSASDGLARFRQEAEAVAQLQHPHLVQIFEIDLGGPIPYLALEYVDGGSLKEKLDGSPQKPRVAAELIETLARAIHVAHECQIVHRDLKPANILLANRVRAVPNAEVRPPHDSTPTSLPGFSPVVLSPVLRSSLADYVPKIVDFGLAKHLDEDKGLTWTGMIAGTPSYMAPELTSSNKERFISPAVDVYSLGVILYELLSGRVPLEGASAVDTMLLVREQDPVPLRHLQPKLSRDLETICMKCLEKDPRKRYRSAIDLADELRRFLGGKPITARPTSAWERGLKLARRYPVVAALSVAVLLVAVLGFAGVSWQWGQAVAERDRSRMHERAALIARDDANWEKQQAVTFSEQADAAKRQALTARDQAETNVYFSRVAQARLEWDLEYNLDAANILLDKCRPDPGQTDRRGWEWHYLQGLLHAELFTLNGFTNGYIDRLAYSPDGKTLAVAGGGNPFFGTQGPGSVQPGDVVLWDAFTGRKLETLRGHGNLVHGLAFRPDGKWLASASIDQSIVIWDMETAKLHHAWRNPHSGTAAIAFSPDGQTLATANREGTVSLWNAETGKEEFFFKDHKVSVWTVAYSPDGKLIASAGWSPSVGGDVKIWDAATGQVLQHFDGFNSYQHSNLTFSPDGKLLVTINQSARIWEVATGRLLHSLAGHHGETLGVAFRPDGLEIATTGADRTVRLWDPHTGTEKAILRGHATRVRCAAYHPSGKYLASGDNDHIVKVWDLTRPSEYTIPHPVHALRFEAIHFDATGQHIMALDPGGDLRVRDCATGLLKKQLRLDFTKEWRAPANLADFDAMGRTLAGVSRTDERVVNIWDTANGHVLRVLGGSESSPDDRASFPLLRLSLSADGGRLATAGMGKTSTGIVREICVWDVTTGHCLLQFLTPGASGRHHGQVALSADGEMLAFDEYTVTAKPDTPDVLDGRVKVCDVKRGKDGLAAPKHTIGGYQSILTSLAFSPQSTYLGSSDQNVIHVFDLQSGKPVYTRPVQGSIYQLAFSPDEKRLACASRDQLHLWDVGSGEGLLILRGAAPRPGDNGFNPKVTWSRDGRRLASSNWNGSVSVWDESDRSSPLASLASVRQAEERRYAWHLDQAQAHLGKPLFDFHWKQLENAKLPTGPLTLHRGYLLALQGQWKKAAAECSDSLRKQPIGSLEDWLRTAALHVLAGDEEGARRIRQQALEQYKPGTSSEPATDVIWISYLVKGSPPDGELFAKIAVDFKGMPNVQRQQALALAFYRMGRFKEAEALIAPSAGAKQTWPTVNLRVVNALICQALGKSAEARESLVATENWLMQTTEGNPHRILQRDLTDGLMFLLLLGEAHSAIDRPAK